MNWSALQDIVQWIIAIGPWIKRILDGTQQTLTIGKTGMELLNASKNLIEKDTIEHPDNAVDRVNAIATMTKSLAPLAFAEVLFYAVKTAGLVCIFKLLTDFLTRKEAQIMARKPKEHP